MYIDLAENADISRKILGFLITAAEKCLGDEGIDPSHVEISLSVVSKEEIRDLNRQFRDTDRVTDVLSFPQYESADEIREASMDGAEVIAIGDVVICDEVAHSQAEQYGHSYEREFVYLFVHSVLHLLGYDHMEPEEKAVMRAEEENVMSYIGLERGFTPAEDLSFAQAGVPGAEGSGSGEDRPVETENPDMDREDGTEPPEEDAADPGADEETLDYEGLMDLAVHASDNSYAPYSGFHVGAALLASDGTVYTGVNIENSSYGATICAERSAVSAAVTDGKRAFDAIAVYSPDGESEPCGICRQVLFEFGEHMKVITCDAEGQLSVRELGALLPKGFVL